MKKRLAALVCAGMLACALPALAWADEAAPTGGQEAAPAAAAAVEKVHANATTVGASLYGEVKASSIAIIGTTETASDDLKGMPSFSVVVDDGVGRIDFEAAALGDYADCNKVEVHVRPASGSPGAEKTFFATKAANDKAFFFTSVMFNIDEIAGGDAYQGDFIVTLVFSKVDEGASAPAEDDPAPLPAAGADTGSKSPKTGLGLDGVAGASAAMLVAAGGVALALRRKLAK